MIITADDIGGTEPGLQICKRRSRPETGGTHTFGMVEFWMRKTARILGMFLWCVCLSPISHAETDSAVPQKDPLTAAHQNLKDALLTVETDQQSAAECLNRIAGPYDTGYAPAESAYRSLNHTKAGPFGRQDSNQ